jgi:hypothetical protein
MMIHQLADGDVFTHNIQRVLGANLFAFAAADTVFITVDKCFIAVFFRPIMNAAGQTLTQSPQLMHLSCENITWNWLFSPSGLAHHGQRYCSL